MTKEEYLQMRELIEVPTSALFDFYKEKGGLINNIQDFEKLLVKAQNTPAIITQNGPKRVTANSIYSNFYDYYNKKFNV
jgi:hypothetical protein